MKKYSNDVIKLKNEIKKYKKLELKKIYFKGFFSELRFSIMERFFYLLKYICLYKKKIRIRFICFRCYKTHSFYSFLNVYRIILRENMSFGNYSGFKRSTW